MLTMDLTDKLGTLAPKVYQITILGYEQLLEELKFRRTFSMLNATIPQKFISKDPLDLEEKVRRITYMKLSVSLWAHAAMIDGDLAHEEELSVGQMMNDFFDGESAFISSKDFDTDAVFDELAETFILPQPLTDVIDYVRQNPILKYNFYEEACCIIASDGKVVEQERLFLNNIALYFRIDSDTQKRIESNYIIDPVGSAVA